jgi:hypothetical protein
MNISELTEQEMKEILLRAYKIGNESDYIEARDLIEEIKQQIITVLRRK